METEMQTAPPPPQKFSRYRSVRIAALKEAPAAPSVPALPADTAGDGVRHEPSRYKHKRPTSGLPGFCRVADLGNGDAASLDALRAKGVGRQSLEGIITPNTGKTRLLDTQDLNGTSSHSRELPINRKEDHGTSSITGRANDPLQAQPSGAQHQDLHLSEGSGKSIARRSCNDAQREAYAIRNGPVNRESKLRQAQRDNGQRTKQSTRNQEVERVDHRWPTTREKMGQIKDIDSGPVTAHTGANVAALKSDQTPFPSPEKRSLRKSLPGIDAPVSAVNTGERNVRVKFNNSSIVVPVTAPTTVDDVLCFAAESFTGSFDVSSAVLLESFKQLGLERPLRRYEHIRDILNSWDHDNQNSLLIEHSFTGVGENTLGIASVAARQPEGTSVSIYHSQKSGIWDKRQITLRQDGQIIVAKSNGETTNICHMSDFDLYTPTHHQMKKLNPPKKMCFAIKSQQKSSMFLTTANFVHFFSTKDKVVAETWYKAVHNWRSWYLVHVMGNGQKRLIPQPALTHSVDRSLCAERTTNRERRTSQTFPNRPMFSSKPAEARKDTAVEPRTKPVTVPEALAPIDATLRSRPFRNHAAPPVSFPKHFATISDTEPLATLVQAHGNSSQLPQAQGETTVVPGQLGSQPSQRFGAPHTNPPHTVPGKPSTELSRSTSQRQKAALLFRPLIDLTPQVQESPQYIKRGRGITISQKPIGGLVNVATNPDVPVPLPPITISQRPGNGYKNETGIPRAMTTRAPAPHATSPLPSPEKQEVAFLMGGLLAQADVMREGRKSGKVAKTGDREGKEPMLDIAESSIYIPGSLLAGVEKQAGSTGPTIDREKTKEVMTSTGECA